MGSARPSRTALTRSRRHRRRLTVAAAAALALGGVYIASLLPVVRGDAGTVSALDVWLNTIVDVGVVLVVVLRGWVDRRSRAVWWCLGAGLAAALLGSIGYYAHYRYLDPVPYPSWSDVGWVAFYPLAFAAVILGLRDRGLGDVSRAMALDGIVAAFTVAAFAAAFVFEPALEVTDGSAAAVAMTLAYPIADLLLVMLLAGAYVLVGGPGRVWGWLGLGLLIYFVTDALYVSAVDGYAAGDPLDIGWVAARMCFVVAALQPLRQRRIVRPEGLRPLVAPAACAIAAVALLYAGTRADLPALATTLALVAVLAALLRTLAAFSALQSLAETRRQSLTDELSGLPNRRAFLRAVSEATVQARPRAVLLLDLDRFKEVNDALGHAAGDELLRVVAERLRRAVPARDRLARLGGDEFAVLAGVRGADDALALGARLRQALVEPIHIGPAELIVDASIGVALAPEQASGPDELLQLADLAMYAAKERGGGALLYEDARDGAGRERLEIVAQLREALRGDQLFLEFQPKLDLATERIVGVEALVRWRHPSRGVLGPQHFVELAESSGAMQALTEAVLQLALGQLRRWRAEGLDLTIAVNVSPSDLHDDAFPARIAAELAAASIPPGQLVLEVTEGHVMEDREKAAEVLGALRRVGTGVAIDDFGTGYSSLAYLAELPATELKLDRSFIGPMTTDARARTVVCASLRLARELDLVSVGEGVEDMETLTALREAGCTQAQGFLLGRPTTADAITAAVGARRPTHRSSVADVAGQSASRTGVR